MWLAEKLIPRSYRLLDYDWTPLSHHPCWLSSVAHHFHCYMPSIRSWLSCTSAPPTVKGFGTNAAFKQWKWFCDAFTPSSGSIALFTLLKSSEKATKTAWVGCRCLGLHAYDTDVLNEFTILPETAEQSFLKQQLFIFNGDLHVSTNHPLVLITSVLIVHTAW